MNYDQGKITSAFESWLALNETERAMLEAQQRGYIICTQASAPPTPAERKRGRPKGARTRKANGAPVVAAEVQ